MKYIAIDIGSSFCKAAVLDLESRTIAALVKKPTPEKLPHENPRYFENRAMTFVELVQELADQFTAAFDNIQGILLSTQMHGFVYAVPGREDAYTSWQDLRCLDAMGDGVSYLHYLEQKIPPEEIVRAGVYIKPSLGLCNLYAMLDSSPGMPRNGTLHTLGSYIIARLTGRNICHISNAAPLGMVDIVDRAWNMQLLAKLGLDTVNLPELTADDFTVCGTMQSNGRKIPVYPDWGDQQIADSNSNPNTRTK